jgi:preprotein translocase subunit SecG
MITILATIHIIICILLILIILIQPSKGGGLAGFFAGGADTLLGTKSISFLVKITLVLAVIFTFTLLSISYLVTRQYKSIPAAEKVE